MDATERLPATPEGDNSVTAREAAVKKSFEQRFADALRRRLYPNTRLRLKTLARDTGYSEDTITRWTQAKHRVFAGAVEDVASYFAKRFGDDRLLHEVFASAAGWVSPSDPAVAADWSLTAPAHLRPARMPIAKESATA
jgi:hypothetical protein